MVRYDAFVSYSHIKDHSIAATLQSIIQKLGKPWYRRRSLRLFRDDTSLSATPHLWPSIEQALGESRFFILLASPEAAASKWVNKEVAYWLDHNSADTILIGVTDGELSWNETTRDFAASEKPLLPPALAGRFLDEPKWVDLTAYRKGADTRDAKFTDLAANFASAIRGIPKEDLFSQEIHQQRRALALAWGATASLLILAIALAIATSFVYRAQLEALAQKNAAEKRYNLAVDASLDLIIALATAQQQYDPSKRFYQTLTDLKLNNAIYERLLHEKPDERRVLDCKKAERLLNLASTDSELRQIIVQPNNVENIIEDWTKAASMLNSRWSGSPCVSSNSSRAWLNSSAG
jgi:hypothetical protein